MSDDIQNQNQEDSNENETVDELSMLKQRARMMNIPFSNNISVETLKERIQAKMDGEASKEESSVQVEKSQSVNPFDLNFSDEAPVPTAPAAVPTKKKSLRQLLIDENMRLVRLRITNLDPKKKDIPGEVFTVANEYLGTVSKFVPFGEHTEGGYHVPYVIYKMMKNRKFLNIRTFVNKKNNNQIEVIHQWAQEFALEVLEPLTPKELQNLATAQIAAGSVG